VGNVYHLTKDLTPWEVYDISLTFFFFFFACIVNFKDIYSFRFEYGEWNDPFVLSIDHDTNNLINVLNSFADRTAKLASVDPTSFS
jgi:hypothetical protein